MSPTYTEIQHYENLAFHYANEAILLKCAASIHVEAFDDAVFWEKTITHFLPEKKFNFIWASNSHSGTVTSSSNQCLKYKNYLSSRFFICIDSDYRYLLQEDDINPTNFIFQTYTYSIENHFCYAKKLSAITKHCTGISNTIFDFEAFLLDYSNALYDAFIWHLYFLKQGDFDTFGKDEFNKILSLNGIPGFSIKNNGKAIIDELSRRCTTKTAYLQTAYQTVDLSPEKAYFAALGLNQDNSYLYIRGHNLFDLIEKIGNEVNNDLLRIEKKGLGKNAISQLYAQATPFKRELERVIEFGEYKEILNVERDLKQLI